MIDIKNLSVLLHNTYRPIPNRPIPNRPITLYVHKRLIRDLWCMLLDDDTGGTLFRTMYNNISGQLRQSIRDDHDPN